MFRRGGGGLTRGVCVCRGVLTQGVSARRVSARAVSAQGVFTQGVSAQGVSAQGGCLPQCILGYTPPLDRMTDACENITLPQLSCGR